MDNRSLISKISKAADTISRDSIRGSASYIVASKYVYDQFNQLHRNHRRKEKIKRIYE
jgi:uncharacterized linocin/CFP29 family protein